MSIPMYVLTLRRNLTSKILDSATQASALDSEDSPRKEDHPTGYHEHTSSWCQEIFHVNLRTVLRKFSVER